MSALYLTVDYGLEALNAVGNSLVWPGMQLMKMKIIQEAVFDILKPLDAC